MAKKDWRDMSTGEKTIGIVAMVVVLSLITWFVVGSSQTEPKTIDDKIRENVDAITQ